MLQISNIFQVKSSSIYCQSQHKYGKDKINHQSNHTQKINKQNKQNNPTLIKHKSKLHLFQPPLSPEPFPLSHKCNNFPIKQPQLTKNLQYPKSTIRTSQSICTQTFIDKIFNIDFKIAIPNHHQSYSYLGKHRLSENISTLLTNYNVINAQKEYSCKQLQRQNGSKKELTLQKLITFNSQHIKSIPQSVLKQVTLNQFVWLLNELQFVEKSQNITKTHVKQAFKLPQIQTIINNLLHCQDSLQTLLNSVYYKKSLKMLLIYSTPQFLNQYNFISLSVLKPILLMDDFQLLKYIFNKYPKFSQAIFGNTTNNQSILSNQIGENNQWTTWKHILNPSLKTYKYLYKRDKMFKKNYLTTNHTKNWHFPEYTNHQILIPKANKLQNKILTAYQQFQQNIYQTKQKFPYKYPNFQNPPSIAKKIYLQILDQAKNSVRNIGKIKSKSNQKHQNEISKQPFNTNYYNLNKNLSIKSINTLKSIFLSPSQGHITQRSHHNLQNTQHIYHHNKNVRKNSITVVSKQKYQIKLDRNKFYGDKKKGISLCSHSDISTIQLQPNVKSPNNTYKHINRTVYIDLSKKSQTPKSDVDNMQAFSNKENIYEDQVLALCSSFLSN